MVTGKDRVRQIVEALLTGLAEVALTLWLGSDDENGETSVSGIDLYPNIPGALRDLRKLRGQHPHDHVTTTLDHPKDRRLLGVECPAPAFALEPSAPAAPPFFTT